MRRRDLMRVPFCADVPIGVNLVKVDAIQSGGYITANGAWVRHGPSCCTDFIAINPAFSYKVTTQVAEWDVVSFWTVDKEFISSPHIFGYQGCTDKEISGSMIPENARYIRMNGKTEGKYTMSVVRIA